MKHPCVACGQDLKMHADFHAREIERYYINKPILIRCDCGADNIVTFTGGSEFTVSPTTDVLPENCIEFRRGNNADSSYGGGTGGAPMR